MTSNKRSYGHPPFKVAVLHGGPGAAGEMAPVAKELSNHMSVLEPFQTASSIDGQINELHAMVQKEMAPPITLIGWSWGAALAFLFAANHPSLIKKLILVSTPPFEEPYAATIRATRLKRLSENDQIQLFDLEKELKNCDSTKKKALFQKLGGLLSKADNYSPSSEKTPSSHCNYSIYQNVSREFKAMRHSGELLKAGSKIQCPVLAIHGDYDPHPSDGVKIPLSVIIERFRFLELKECGHTPWLEEKQKNRFYRIIEKEI